MYGCSTSCPKCKHEFECCAAPTRCRPHCARRVSHCLSGGGLVSPCLEPSPCSDAITPCLSPQVSPSVPLTFFMPQATFPFVPLLAPTDPSNPEEDLERLRNTVQALRLSGWFYEGVTYTESHELLKDSEVGTFLVRNSADPRFLFSLSIQTERGPTSVRLYYNQGYFRLDAQPHLLSAMPIFPCVPSLVEHYVFQSKLCKNSSQVWVDFTGKWYSPIVLERPLLRKSAPPSLKHLARIAINKALRQPTRPRVAFIPSPHAQLELPKSLTAYIEEYPYSL